jgi:DNA repair exonuclease SbcCD nuclease subunit
MKPVRFIHCADLHIDTPFKGISEIRPELKELLYQSTYQSFNNIIDLAIKERVDCIVIAGDIYDSEDKSLRAQLRFRDSLVRLSEYGIQAFVVYGNHDPLSGWSAKLEWPAGVHRFLGENVECIPLLRHGEVVAKVYGISFAKGDIKENLALKFPKADKGIPCIGLLHANVGGNTAHDPYSPCTVEELSSTGMEYWALGHVHTYEILKPANPAIVYPGCSQSRNPREVGPKGCCLITLELGNDPIIEFIPTDIVRYKSDFVNISSCQSIDDVISSIIEKCQAISDELNKRGSIIHLALKGRTELNKELQKGNSAPGILEDVREHFAGNDSWIWLDKLMLSTAGTYDIDLLRQGNDFIADIISIFDELGDIKNQNWKELETFLSPLFSKWQGRDYLEELTDEELLGLANEARGQMLDLLVTD